MESSLVWVEWSQVMLWWGEVKLLCGVVFVIALSGVVMVMCG